MQEKLMEGVHYDYNDNYGYLKTKLTYYHSGVVGRFAANTEKDFINDAFKIARNECSKYYSSTHGLIVIFNGDGKLIIGSLGNSRVSKFGFNERNECTSCNDLNIEIRLDDIEKADIGGDEFKSLFTDEQKEPKQAQIITIDLSKNKSSKTIIEVANKNAYESPNDLNTHANSIARALKQSSCSISEFLNIAGVKNNVWGNISTHIFEIDISILDKDKSVVFGFFDGVFNRLQTCVAKIACEAFEAFIKTYEIVDEFKEIEVDQKITEIPDEMFNLEDDNNSVTVNDFEDLGEGKKTQDVLNSALAPKIIDEEQRKAETSMQNDAPKMSLCGYTFSNNLTASTHSEGYNTPSNERRIFNGGSERF